MSRARLHRMSLIAVPLVFAAALHAQAVPPAAAAAPDLSDPEVAHVAVTANNVDIDAAKFAETRTHNAGVRQFAATMITDHSAVNQQAAALAQKLGVTPKDNAVSQSLQSGAADARKKLEPLHGAAFDRVCARRPRPSTTRSERCEGQNDGETADHFSLARRAFACSRCVATAGRTF